MSSSIDSVYSEDGVIILMDMGSAVMTTEMVLEEYDNDKIKMVDAPLVEGAVAASVSSLFGSDMASIIDELAETKRMEKF